MGIFTIAPEPLKYSWIIWIPENSYRSPRATEISKGNMGKMCQWPHPSWSFHWQRGNHTTAPEPMELSWVMWVRYVMWNLRVTVYFRLPDRYDVITGTGLLIDSHVKEDCFPELIRIVKPGIAQSHDVFKTWLTLRFTGPLVGQITSQRHCPPQRQVMRTFDYFLDVSLNNLSNKQPSDRRFGKP